MKKKYIRLLIIILGLALMAVTVANAQEDCQDLTYILESLDGNLSLGNSCGNGNGENPDYQYVCTNSLELNGFNLQIMWADIYVHTEITDFGDPRNLFELIEENRIRLTCTQTDLISSIRVNAEVLSVETEEMIVFDMEVWPNPARESVNVKGRGIAKLSMYDINGRIVHETKNNSLERIKIDLTNISSGLYFLRATNEYDVILVKQVIIR